MLTSELRKIMCIANTPLTSPVNIIGSYLLQFCQNKQVLANLLHEFLFYMNFTKSVQNYQYQEVLDDPPHKYGNNTLTQIQRRYVISLLNSGYDHCILLLVGFLGKTI